MVLILAALVLAPPRYIVTPYKPQVSFAWTLDRRSRHLILSGKQTDLKFSSDGRVELLPSSTWRLAVGSIFYSSKDFFNRRRKAFVVREGKGEWIEEQERWVEPQCFTKSGYVGGLIAFPGQNWFASEGFAWHNGSTNRIGIAQEVAIAEDGTTFGTFARDDQGPTSYDSEGAKATAFRVQNGLARELGAFIVFDVLKDGSLLASSSANAMANKSFIVYSPVMGVKSFLWRNGSYEFFKSEAYSGVRLLSGDLDTGFVGQAVIVGKRYVSDVEGPMALHRNVAVLRWLGKLYDLNKLIAKPLKKPLTSASWIGEDGSIIAADEDENTYELKPAK